MTNKAMTPQEWATLDEETRQAWLARVHAPTCRVSLCGLCGKAPEPVVQTEA